MAYLSCALGSIALLALFLAVVLRALWVANRQPDLYAKLLATGLAAVFGFQILIIAGGVQHLFPLTGITLPFISYGGSSLVPTSCSSRWSGRSRASGASPPPGARRLAVCKVWVS